MTEALINELRRLQSQESGWNASRAVLAGMLLQRGMVRVKVCRNGTRPYVLTPAGRAAIAKLPRYPGVNPGRVRR